MPREVLGAAALAAVATILSAVPPAAALDLSSFEKNVSVQTLDNGLTLIVYERSTAPVVSFFTHVDVGSAQEVPGITGLAHMFEHMAFKGTSVIGTKDFAAEKRALDKVDQAYAAFARERDGRNPDEAKLSKLTKELEQAQAEAEELIKPNEFGEIIDREGGVGLNAFTNTDSTGYMFSLPANKVELWAYLESERYLDPVYRQFYKERDVVQEERRMRTDSNPIGRLLEAFLATAFDAHPYKQPVVGYMSDLKSFTREDADAFCRTHYVPANITIAIVGDVDAEQVMPIVAKYFNRLPAGPDPAPLRTKEPAGRSEKTIVMPDASQPVYLEGYHRPAVDHPDNAVYNAMSDILANGRDSRLYRHLVRDDKVAVAAGAFNGMPGTKYPHLMLFWGMTNPGSTNEDVQAAIREEIERLKNEPVGAEELAKVKTRAKANLIRGLASNNGIASALATNYARFGDWREMFYAVDKIEKVTAADIQRVANETFKSNNRTVAMIVNQKSDAPASKNEG